MGAKTSLSAGVRFNLAARRAERVGGKARIREEHI